MDREELRSGREAKASITELLRRVRLAHPTAGLYQAAEIEFWWATPRSTDHFGQLLWVDDAGRPSAAVLATDFGDGLSQLYDASIVIVPITLPDASPAWVEHVIDRGLDHLAEAGVASVDIEVGRDDELTQRLLTGRGFERHADGLIECWLDTATLPPVSPLADGYRLVSRAELEGRPHHLDRPRAPDVAARLRETVLYRPDLDLVVLGPDDAYAAYSLFWYDPVTGTGAVEPMRTHDAHQRRGLGRHLLTSGVARLAEAGAQRVSIGYEPDNPASGPLYRSVGFVPFLRTDVWRGPTAG